MNIRLPNHLEGHIPNLLSFLQANNEAVYILQYQPMCFLLEDIQRIKEQIYQDVGPVDTVGNNLNIFTVGVIVNQSLLIDSQYYEYEVGSSDSDTIRVWVCKGRSMEGCNSRIYSKKGVHVKGMEAHTCQSEDFVMTALQKTVYNLNRTCQLTQSVFLKSEKQNREQDIAEQNNTIGQMVLSNDSLGIVHGPKKTRKTIQTRSKTAREKLAVTKATRTRKAVVFGEATYQESMDQDDDLVEVKQEKDEETPLDMEVEDKSDTDSTVISYEEQITNENDMDDNSWDATELSNSTDSCNTLSTRHSSNTKIKFKILPSVKEGRRKLKKIADDLGYQYILSHRNKDIACGMWYCSQRKTQTCRAYVSEKHGVKTLGRHQHTCITVQGDDNARKKSSKLRRKRTPTQPTNPQPPPNIDPNNHVFKVLKGATIYGGDILVDNYGFRFTRKTTQDGKEKIVWRCQSRYNRAFKCKALVNELNGVLTPSTPHRCIPKPDIESQPEVTYEFKPHPTCPGEELLIDSLNYQYRLFRSRSSNIMYRCIYSKKHKCQGRVYKRDGKLIAGIEGHTCKPKPYVPPKDPLVPKNPQPQLYVEGAEITYTIIPCGTSRKRNLLMDNYGYCYTRKTNKITYTPRWLCAQRNHKDFLCRAFVVGEEGNFRKGPAPHTCNPERYNITKKHQCDVCGKVFLRRYQFEEHKTVHSSEKPFTCLVCNKSFRLKTLLQRHSVIHDDKRNHVCLVCGKAFYCSSHLKRHTRTHMRQEKPLLPLPINHPPPLQILPSQHALMQNASSTSHRHQEQEHEPQILQQQQEEEQQHSLRLIDSAIEMKTNVEVPLTLAHHHTHHNVISYNDVWKDAFL